MESLTYTVQIEPAEEGGFVASIPSLPGCFTQGEDIEETIAMARDAIEGHLAILQKHGVPIPVEKESVHPFAIGVSVKAPIKA